MVEAGASLPVPIYRMGVVGSSNKENERRVAIHPAHMKLIPEACRKKMYFEVGYGKLFGVKDEELAAQCAGLKTREDLFKDCDIILLCKPCSPDFPYFREGQILWGWPHCVQFEPIAQLAIEKKMTVIAWENMNVWNKEAKGIHVFQKNNELAGYSSVLHALPTIGTTGHYGEAKKCCVISYGSVARGSAHALLGMGFTDLTILTRRPDYAIMGQMNTPVYKQVIADPVNKGRWKVKEKDQTTHTFLEELSKYDIIVNCILQDTDNIITFVKGDEVDKLKQGALIIDISCDDNIGFDFAKETTFEHPTFKVGSEKQITYYAVGHSPSYYYSAATYENSNALLDFIPCVMGGAEAWKTNPIIHKAIDILDGTIRFKKILSFQNRKDTYPHQKI